MKSITSTERGRRWSKGWTMAKAITSSALEIATARPMKRKSRPLT